MKLAESFLRTASPTPITLDNPELAALDALIERCWQEGAGAWPDIALAAEDFASYLGPRAGPPWGEGWPGCLTQLQCGDLYLCASCLREDPAALRALEQVFLSQVPIWLRRFDALLADEVVQILRVKLLVRGGAGRPLLGDYAGRGPLKTWLRVAAFRTAFDQKRTGGSLGRRGSSHEAEAAFHVQQDQELAYIKLRYSRVFQDALREAFATLSAEARSLLRMHVLGGLSTRQIAVLLQTSQPTVVRRMENARTQVRMETRRFLGERIDVSSREFDSLARLLQSQLDISLEEALAE